MNAKTKECCEWMLVFLMRYAWPASELDAAAKAEGFTAMTIRKAKTGLGRNGTGQICFHKDGFNSDWWIGLAPKAEWVLRPAKPGQPDTVHLPAAPSSSAPAQKAQLGVLFLEHGEFLFMCPTPDGHTIHATISPELALSIANYIRSYVTVNALRN